MVKVTLKEESKVIEHECEFAFACLGHPAEAPAGQKAMVCLVGETNLKELSRVIAKCVLNIFSHMSHGDEDVEGMAMYEFLCALAEEEKEDENPAKDVDVEPLPTGKGWG
jgi:hypothetical protein